MEKKVFVSGPVTPGFLSDSIQKHQAKTNIGAHNIFLGQVRADRKEGKTVKAIEYTAYKKMALQEFHNIREKAFSKYSLTCMHIYHSLGVVRAGEICFFVFVSAPHRDIVFEALKFVVEEVKARVPVFGKEIFEDNTHTWKVNT